MMVKKVLMNFNNVRKFERSAEFEYEGDNYMVSVSVNPWNDDVLFSLYLNRELVIQNRVCLVGEYMLRGWGDESFYSLIKCDFAFLYLDDKTPIGNKVNADELGNTMFLYLIMEEVTSAD